VVYFCPVERLLVKARGWKLLPLFIFSIVLISEPARAQHSVAREWNEALLQAIREDFARPTVHARNLWHTSVVMYDAWAVYSNSETYLLGKTVAGFNCDFSGIELPATEIQSAQEEAISFAAYRLLKHRFKDSPGKDSTLVRFDSLLASMGYDSFFVSTDYSDGSAAALGNHIAQCMIEFGFQDGSNEAGQYENEYYFPINPPIAPVAPGNPTIIDINRWQAISLEVAIDQAGNLVPAANPPFLSPEWGNVVPFSLTSEDLDVYERFDNEYLVYHDPGPPPFLKPLPEDLPEEYKWGFSLVSVWSGQLDPADGVMLDISPASIGNNPPFPQTFPEYPEFFNLEEGGDQSAGRELNPFTGQPYEPQMVPRGDYARVLAEFWADGPDSETPPGHWFTILNYVNDHPDFEKRFMGEGSVLDDLEWDIISYFTLGGALHDVAIAAWGIKGWYDYLRPISAIRLMADKGQSTDTDLPRYDPYGIPLVEGYIELVKDGDPLAGLMGENIDKIKLFAWRGPDYIDNPETDFAGVGWILADNWWPYQRPTFVTPPFAGYISGHSTYSRAAAEVMTLMSGDAYFPGGMGTFEAKKNEFLVFEEGPSVDVVLQWATYRDASDQTSLSRIWGGIHPPADDIPGRIIGEEIGVDAFELAQTYFVKAITGIAPDPGDLRRMFNIYPNPVQAGGDINVLAEKLKPQKLQLINLQGQVVLERYFLPLENPNALQLSTQGLHPGLYLLRLVGNSVDVAKKVYIRP